MAVKDDVAGLFEQEWARFWAGWDALSPEAQEAELARRARARTRTGLPNTVSLPGWDDVIHLTPRPEVSAADRTEFYAAQRERREPNLAPDTVAEIGRRRERARIASTSAAPPYSAAFGQMLTALDNVQDFTTTVATLGRLALWPAIRGIDAVTPRFGVEGWARSVFGATPQAAQQLARAASTEAAATAFRRELQESLLGRLAAAARGVEAIAMRQRAIEAAELAARAAGKVAFEQTLKRAGLGIGTRLLGRLIPGLGWVLLAGDLLAILGWLGTVGMVGYGAACFGLRQGLAAGAFPLLMRATGGVGPCGLRGAVSALGDLNPFAAERRLERSLKMARGMPTIGNLLEVFQTTDQLWGVGVSFGAIVGAFTEGAYGAELANRGESVTVRPGGTPLGLVGVGTGVLALQTRSKALGALAAGSLLADTVGRTATAPLKVKHQAAQQLQNAAVINATQDTFTEVEHIEALVNYTVALDLIASDLQGVPWQDFLAERMPFALTPPEYLDPLTVELVRELDPRLDTLGRWPVPGGPRSLTTTEFVEHYSREIPGALRNFLAPRRDSPVGMFAGGVVNLLTDRIFGMLDGGPQPVRHRWSREWKALLALGQHNRVVNIGAGEEAVWAFWLELLELVDRRDDGQLSAEEIDAAAAKRGVSLFLVEQAYLRTPLNT